MFGPEVSIGGSRGIATGARGRNGAAHLPGRGARVPSPSQLAGRPGGDLGIPGAKAPGAGPDSLSVVFGAAGSGTPDVRVVLSRSGVGRTSFRGRSMVVPRVVPLSFQERCRPGRGLYRGSGVFEGIPATAAFGPGRGPHGSGPGVCGGGKGPSRHVRAPASYGRLRKWRGRSDRI